MSEALKFAAVLGGTALGTVALNTGATALIRKGFGRTLSYTPGMIAGGAASVTLINLITLGTTLAAGGLAAKLLSREISITHACALSVFNLVIPHLITGTITDMLKDSNSLGDSVSILLRDYRKACSWALGIKG
jgi:hypothetical protein